MFLFSHCEVITEKYYLQVYFLQIMPVIAETEYGRVRGVVTTSALDTEYISFFGIPYATPPIGELRFKVSNTAPLSL